MTDAKERGWWTRFALILAAMLLLTAIVVVAIVRDRIVNQQNWQVTVNGRGVVQYQPDQATVNLAVKVDKKPQASDALKELNTRMDKVLAAIKDLQVDAADIQTQAYSLYPEYEYINEKSTLVGYSAYQNLAVKIKGLDENGDLVAKVVTEATKAGANEVNGIVFEAGNLDDLKQQARVKAIADAKARAGELAREAGVKLDEVVGWWENYVQGPGLSSSYYYGDGKGGGGGYGGAVPSGAQEIIMEIGVNYKIDD